MMSTRLRCPLPRWSAQDLSQDELVSRYARLVKRIAYHLVSRLPPTIEVDDLIQAGMIGLLDAAKKYSASKGASFDSYAGIRIRGAMLDEVRKIDWAPRSVHRQVRELVRAVRAVERRASRAARPADVAQAMGITLEEYHCLLRDAMTARMFSKSQCRAHVEQTGVPVNDAQPGPYETLQGVDFREALVKEIDSLPERERLVLSFYYDDELNLREIGEILDVSESRVCQIHGQALIRLRARMQEWLD